MVVRGGEDRESKSFSEAAGKKAPRVAGCVTRRIIQFSSLLTWLPLAGLEAYCYRVKIFRGYADETMLV
jgi:hypothetical protein